MNTTTTDKLSPRDQFLGDVLTTALEGGIGYWSRAYEINRTPDLTVYSITIVETEPASEALDLHSSFGWADLDAAYDEGRVPNEHIHKVDLHDIATAFNRLTSKRPIQHLNEAARKSLVWSSRHNDPAPDEAPDYVQDIDSDLADIVVQVAVFGDQVVYG